jgi:hypothetical protein
MPTIAINIAMPKIKIRFILESSNKNRYLGVTNTIPSKLVTPAWDGRQAKEPKIRLRPIADRVCWPNPSGCQVISFSDYAKKRE